MTGRIEDLDGRARLKSWRMLILLLNAFNIYIYLSVKVVFVCFYVNKAVTVKGDLQLAFPILY